MTAQCAEAGIQKNTSVKEMGQSKGEKLNGLGNAVQDNGRAT